MEVLAIVVLLTIIVGTVVAIAVAIDDGDDLSAGYLFGLLIGAVAAMAIHILQGAPLP